MKIQEITEDVDFYQLSQVEHFVEALWDKLNIDVKFTRHFLERLNDPRNGKPISSAELIRLFKKEYEQNGKDISQLANMEAVMKDLLTNINLPFIIKDTSHGKEMVAKTIMRKPNFKTPDPEFVVSESRKVFMLDINKIVPTEIKQMDPDVVDGLAQQWNPRASALLVSARKDGKYDLIDGHHRYAALKQRGANQVPVYTVSESNTYQPPELSVGDEVRVGKFKNRKAEIKGFKTDDNNQPVLKTTKGDQKLFKPRISKLMKEAKSDKLGDCFVVSGRNMLDSTTDDLVLVHANVTGQGALQGKRFPHAWNEIGDVVLDYSNGKKIVMRKEQYYKLGHVDTSPGNIAKYDNTTAMKMMVKNRHWGPWDLKDT